MISRRDLITGVAAIGSYFSLGTRVVDAAGAERRFDFAKPLEGWEIVTGKWALEDMADARGGRALVQRATGNEFNVIVAPGGPHADVDVSVRFKPISGREDASGGIVFRFSEGRYYVVRANALEDNFPFLLLRPRPPPDRRRAGKGAGIGAVARPPHPGGRRPHPGLARRPGAHRQPRCAV
jgi:hypothetical protein